MREIASLYLKPEDKGGKDKISALNGRLPHDEERVVQSGADGLILTHGGPEGIVDGPDNRVLPLSALSRAIKRVVISLERERGAALVGESSGRFREFEGETEKKKREWKLGK